jgi:hypothetical protein
MQAVLKSAAIPILEQNQATGDWDDFAAMKPCTTASSNRDTPAIFGTFVPITLGEMWHGHRVQRLDDPEVIFPYPPETRWENE